MICTLRTDCTPARLVALERQGRKAWPTMVSRFEARIQRYGGIARHDSTGLGDVVAGYLTTPAWGVRLVGRTRSDLFSNCISGIERGSLGAPRITFMYKEHLYRRIGDLLVRATLPIPSWREVWPPLSAGCISAGCRWTRHQSRRLSRTSTSIEMAPFHSAPRTRSRHCAGLMTIRRSGGSSTHVSADVRGRSMKLKRKSVPPKGDLADTTQTMAGKLAPDLESAIWGD